MCSFQFGSDAVFPNLYSESPVSPIAVSIDALWYTLQVMFCSLHAFCSCVCVVADSGSPYMSNAISCSFASCSIDSSSTFSLCSSSNSMFRVERNSSVS